MKFYKLNFKMHDKHTLESWNIISETSYAGLALTSQVKTFAHSKHKTNSRTLKIAKEVSESDIDNEIRTVFALPTFTIRKNVRHVKN